MVLDYKKYKTAFQDFFEAYYAFNDSKFYAGLNEIPRLGNGHLWPRILPEIYSTRRETALSSQPITRFDFSIKPPDDHNRILHRPAAFPGYKKLPNGEYPKKFTIHPEYV